MGTENNNTVVNTHFIQASPAAFGSVTAVKSCEQMFLAPRRVSAPVNGSASKVQQWLDGETEVISY